MTGVAVPFTGWGRDTWSAQAFGEGNVTTTALSGFVGDVTTSTVRNISVSLVGFEASAIGSGVDTTISVRPLLVGQQANAATSGVLFWRVIVPNQASGFEPVLPNGQSNWVEITPEVA